MKIAAAAHYAHAHHGYVESQTRVVYTHDHVTHVARRFFRDDVPESGKVEVYTVAPDKDPSSAFNEDWLGYAVPGTRSGDAAIAAIATAVAERCGDQSDTEARFAAIEL